MANLKMTQDNLDISQNRNTLWIKYVVPTLTGRSSYRCGNYVFTYDKNRNPIPVEVEEEVARMLLALTERPCRCHHIPNYKPKNLFQEVVGEELEALINKPKNL